MRTEVGDKVRMKSGAHAGERGLVEAVDGRKLVVRLESSGEQLQAVPKQVINFSLSSRKAWVTCPKRPVGRRKGSKKCDRITVALRLDRQLWEHFLGLEGAGVIADRTSLVNEWFREKLAEFDPGGRPS